MGERETGNGKRETGDRKPEDRKQENILEISGILLSNF